MVEFYLQLVLGIINFLHLLATTLWIGGMLVNRLIFLPSIREALEPKDIGKLMSYVMKRFRIMVYASIVMLVITGISMTLFNNNYSGPLVFDNTWSIILLIKHTAIAMLILLAVYSFEILAPKVGRLGVKGPSPELVNLQKTQMTLITIGIILGLIILILTGIATAVTVLG